MANAADLDKLRAAAKKALWSKADDKGAYAAALAAGLPAEDCLGYNSHPAMWAAREGRLDWCEFFLERGAPPHWVACGLVCGHGALEQDGDFVCKRSALLEKAAAQGDFSKVAPWGQPLARAAGSGAGWALEILAKSPGALSGYLADQGALQRNAHFGKQELVKLLLSAGADPDARGFKGNAALHEYAASGNEEMAGAVLAAGADPNLANDAGETPLWLAACFGKESVARMLLAAGADPNVRKGGTLLLSKASRLGLAQMVALLAASGASLEERNGKQRKGKTSMQVAAGVGGAVCSAAESAGLGLELDKAGQEPARARSAAKKGL